MVSASTLHVVSTEVAVGSLARAGVAFIMAGGGAWGGEARRKMLLIGDHVAHFALLFGLLAMPLAIVTGIQSSSGDGLNHPLLANKLSLAMTGVGLGIGLLWTRWKRGRAVWNERSSVLMQSIAGALASACVLLTASLGGTYTRGESLLSWLPVSFETVPLMPSWSSLLVVTLAVLMLMFSRNPAAVESGSGFASADKAD